MEMQTRRQIDLPMQVRLAPVASVDVEARTAELVWSTGAGVKRYDWSKGEYFIEELSLDPAHIDMSRMEAGAPLLDTHNTRSLRAILGVVERAWIKDGEARAIVRFSEREDVEPIWRDVQAGIIRNVSVGYYVEKYEEVRSKDNSLPVRRAVAWQPAEVSLVPVGADAGAGTRAGETQHAAATRPCIVIDMTPADAATIRKEQVMSEATQAARAEAASPNAAEAAAAQQQAREAERQRVLDIKADVRAAGLDQKLEDELVRDGVSVEDARKRIIDALAEKNAPSQTRSAAAIQTVTDEADVRRAGVTESLLHRYDPNGHKLSDNGRRYMGRSLLELARVVLEAQGVRTEGMNRSELAKRALMGNSDLPYILADVANKTLRQQYESTPRTFVPWTRRATAPDFKNINRTQLSGFPTLQSVAAGGEVKRGFVSDGKETYALGTYGRVIGITRQTIINDDMDAFTRLPGLAARAAADLESDIVYAVLTANAAMSDTVALFHASHGNLAGSGTAISVDSLGVGRAAMRVQKGLENRVINAAARYLLVSAAKETLAQQYTSSNYVPNSSSTINPFTTLQPIAEPRLDAASATAWYLVADPMQVDTIEYAYLEGAEGPQLETRMGFEVEGMELKVVLDFAAKAIDWRGMYKNPGA